jgi:hypothetical protein
MMSPPTPHLLQTLAAEVIRCHERARQARQRAERAINDQLKSDLLAAEGRWLALALSYERQHQLSRTVADFDEHRKAGAITLTLRERRMALGFYDVTRLTVAYHAVLDQLGLSEREDAATLMVAKRIVDLVAQGERDPERLTAATVEALAK